MSSRIVNLYGALYAQGHDPGNPLLDPDKPIEEVVIEKNVGRGDVYRKIYFGNSHTLLLITKHMKP